MHECVISTVATDVLMLNPQAIGIQNADGLENYNYVLYWTNLYKTASSRWITLDTTIDCLKK